MPGCAELQNRGAVLYDTDYRGAVLYDTDYRGAILYDTESDYRVVVLYDTDYRGGVHVYCQLHTIEGEKQKSRCQI